MFKVLTLASTTLREMLRERIFIVFAMIAVALIGLSVVLGALTFAEQKRIMTDFGLAAIHIASVAISLFVGAYLLAKEIEKQTCLLILSRPITRNQFILGKLLGIVAINTILIFILGLVLSLLIQLSSQNMLAYIKILISLWLESSVLLLFAIMLSLVVRPMLALGGGFIVYFLGHWLGDLSFFAEKSKDEFVILLVKGLHYVTPNFYKMNWKADYFVDNGVPAELFLWMSAQMVAWIFIVLFLTQFLFRRKDIV